MNVSRRGDNQPLGSGLTSLIRDGVAQATGSQAQRELRRAVRSSIFDWVKCALSSAGQLPSAHHRLLLEELERLSRGDMDRLMILMPPGSAKSTYVSILFPGWWFTQHPRTSIIACSHTTRLAAYFARRARGVIAEHAHELGYDIAADTRAAAQWSTTSGGEYCAVGVRSAVIGRRADLAIIDDPIRSRADADSVVMRDNIWNWYRSDLTTRLKPRARIVLIMTRWHEDDLGGRLIEQAPAEWRVVRLSALADQSDPLGRPLDAPLWPAWETTQALQRKREALGERAWLALFQQTPRPSAGALFPVGRLEFIDDTAPNPTGSVVRAWDLAATTDTRGTDPDWTVGVKLMRDAKGRYTVLDVIRIRGTPRKVEETIAMAAHCDGPTVTICLPEDPGQAGKAQIGYLTAGLAGYHVTSSRESGSKTTRAAPSASQVEAGNVALVRAPWNHDFIEELRDFPLGRKDDQVDAFARAFLTLTEIGAPARRANVSYLER